MDKKLIMLCLWAAIVRAQGQEFPAAPLNGIGAPVGSCGPGALYTDNSSGNVYLCKGSSWSSPGNAGNFSFPGASLTINAVMFPAPTVNFPFGPDLVTQHKGPADWSATSSVIRSTTTTSITGGAVNSSVLVSPLCEWNAYFGGNQGPCGSTAYWAQNSGQLLTIGRTINGISATQENLTWSGGAGCAGANTWGVVDATHVCLHPTNSYSGTTDLEQGPGTFALVESSLQIHADAVKPAQQSSNPGLRISDEHGTPYLTLPSDLTTTAPDNFINFGAFARLNQVLVASLPTAATSNAGVIAYVTDSTVISTEGQTCIGGSSNKALAFSNGSAWKCF